MRMIDADALKKLVKKFQDDFPMTNARHYMCDVFLSMIDDVGQVPILSEFERGED